MNNLHIVTVATDPEYYFHYLVDSCKKNGEELTVLGYGEKWQGFVWRFKLMIDYLKKLDENDIVCFIDGYDIICNRNLKELKKKFLEYKKKYSFKIITGVDLYKFKIQEIFSKIYFNECNNNLLNAGTYIGFAKDIYEVLLESYNNNTNNESDDQILLTKYCKIHPEDILLDEKQDFFLTIHQPLFEIDNNLYIKNNEAYYKDKKPFFIHGPSCTYLNLLIKKLNYSIDDNEIYIIKNKMRNNILLKSKHYFIEFVKKYLIIFILIILCFIKIKSKFK